MTAEEERAELLARLDRRSNIAFVSAVVMLVGGAVLMSLGVTVVGAVVHVLGAIPMAVSFATNIEIRAWRKP